MSISGFIDCNKEIVVAKAPLWVVLGYGYDL
jgi:hypothetical protein